MRQKTLIDLYKEKLVLQNSKFEIDFYYLCDWLCLCICCVLQYGRNANSWINNGCISIVYCLSWVTNSGFVILRQIHLWPRCAYTKIHKIYWNFRLSKKSVRFACECNLLCQSMFRLVFLLGLNCIRCTLHLY